MPTGSQGAISVSCHKTKAPVSTASHSIWLWCWCVKSSHFLSRGSLYAAAMSEKQIDHKAMGAAVASQATGLGRTALSLGLVRLLGFIGAAWALVTFIGDASPMTLVTLLVVAAVYAALTLWHGSVEDKRSRLRGLLEYHKRGADRCAGNWDHGQADGARFCEDWHAYARDVDVVGPKGLYALLNTTGSAMGEERLASWLLEEQSVSETQQVQVQELAAHHQWRARWWSVLRHRLDADEEALHTSLSNWLKNPGKPPSVLLGVGAWLFRLLALALVVWAVNALGGPGGAVVTLVVAMLWYPINNMSHRYITVDRDPMHIDRHVRAWREALAVIEEQSFAHPELKALAARAGAADGAAAKLLPITAGLAQARNPLWQFLVGAVTLGDWWFVRRLHTWHGLHAEQLQETIEIIAQMDALCCVASYAAEQGGAWVQPASDKELLKATNLAHPLLPRAVRVGNDICLRSGSVLLLTGANASGKSTLMRALVLSAVLARIGAPVCAESCSLQPLRLATVMRVQDDINAGTSRFQAEVHALRRVLDRIEEDDSRPMLAAFDEILGGTNSHERHIGTRAIVRHLKTMNGVVIVTTHDLDLVNLAEEEDGRFHLAHFADRAVEQGFDSDVAFDYLLREGALQSTNALRVMRAAGLPLDDMTTDEIHTSVNKEHSHG